LLHPFITPPIQPLILLYWLNSRYFIDKILPDVYCGILSMAEQEVWVLFPLLPFHFLADWFI